MTDRILVCVQMWAGDRDAAMSMLRLMADIAPNGKYDADLLVAVRFDCPFDLAGIMQIARSWRQVFTYRSTTKESGWPAGCNSVQHDVLRHYFEKCRRGEWKYEAILMLEADCAPLSRDWLQRINDEWKSCGKPVLGYARPTEDGTPDHTNAVACYSQRLSQIRPDFPQMRTDVGLDWAYRTWLLSHTCPSRTIFMDYAFQYFDEERLFALRSFSGKHPLAGQAPFLPAILHGGKRWQEIHAAIRAKLLAVPVPA